MTDEAIIGSKEERRFRIGGSDFGSVLDVNPYKKRFELVLEKAGVIANYFTGNEFTKRGELLEQSVIFNFENQTGLKVTDTQKVFEKQLEGCLDMVAHIDGFIRAENAIFEAKTTDIKSKCWNDGIPPYYCAQLEFYCYLSGAKKAYIAVATCDGEKVVKSEYFEYIPKMTEEEIINAVYRFTLDVKEASEKYGVINNGLLVQNNTIDDMVSELEEIKEKISEVNKSLKPYETRKKEIESDLKALIGSNLGIESELYKVTLGNRIISPAKDYNITRSTLKIEYKEN